MGVSNWLTASASNKHSAPRPSDHACDGAEEDEMSKTVDRLIDRIFENSPEFGDLAASFDLYLQSVGRADETRCSYLEALHQLVVFLLERYKHPTLDAITRNDVRAFGVSLQRHKEPATVANRVRSLKQFFKWTVGDELIDDDPMTGFKTPKVPVKPVPVVEQEDLTALLDTCRHGKDIWDHRDYAILRLFISTGARRSEIANLLVDDVDMDEGLIQVIGKGSRPRVVAVDRETMTALRLYKRSRSIQPHAELENLWLSKAEVAFTAWGIEQMLHRRCREAGIEKINLHRFRHTFADMAMAGGMSESNLMKIAGWKSRSMLDRYDASRAEERALVAQRKLMNSFKI
ncbi:MAG: tyrosine-type recombinase/integrase [Chloroflexi bacterium]|nr:tyrosine-type recombinase/integrase [Chloroflexota bacterium]